MDIQKLQRALRRKLGAVESKESHHVYFFVAIGGRDLRAAKFSHSSRGQAPDIVLSYTARRLGLSRTELDRFVQCSLSGENVYQRIANIFSLNA